MPEMTNDSVAGTNTSRVGANTKTRKGTALAATVAAITFAIVSPILNYVNKSFTVAVVFAIGIPALALVVHLRAVKGDRPKIPLIKMWMRISENI
jgi:hypothetical protein